MLLRVETLGSSRPSVYAMYKTTAQRLFETTQNRYISYNLTQQTTQHGNVASIFGTYSYLFILHVDTDVTEQNTFKLDLRVIQNLVHKLLVTHELATLI